MGTQLWSCAVELRGLQVTGRTVGVASKNDSQNFVDVGLFREASAWPWPAAGEAVTRVAEFMAAAQG